MLRISKLTDYGTLLLAHLRVNEVRSAAELASETGLAPPTVSKLLKALAREGLVLSTRGASGGYRLAREPREISAADIIDALEGPVSITECSAADSHCHYEDHCSVSRAWQRINVAIRDALDEVRLVDLKRANSPIPEFHFAGMPVTVERKP